MVPFYSKTHKTTLNFNISSPSPAMCKACWELAMVSQNETA